MKNIIYRFLALILICSSYSCLQNTPEETVLPDGMSLDQFRNLDVTAFQHSVNGRDDIENGLDALWVHHSNQQENNPGNTFTMKSFKNSFGNNYLYYQQEVLNDDSLQAIAFFMEYSKSFTGKIKIIQLKESFKCSKGRGQQEWSPDLCL
ncbi:hypothetical protein AAU57_02945 [Nonlabens sp. YIK11]|uniref:hypothetical protein n=1 Tax=Nonlabens sp. YIK11 TaxID=1453349 RepID=UPI0006DCBEE9|nr:hypothetical protein [Nonlabens sp. YIK11]KQC32401.1 hypothetical protein AAU57_02945 [Nonlabens sp. YIK11]